MYPGPEHWRSIPSYKRVKLKAIRYRNVNDVGYLSDVQLQFSHGVQTPLYSAGDSGRYGWALKTVPVDPTRSVRKVSVKVVFGSCFKGLRLLDDYGDAIVNEIWDPEQTRRDEWITQLVPIGYTIIGIQCNTDHTLYLHRLGFVLVKNSKLLWEQNII